MWPGRQAGEHAVRHACILNCVSNYFYHPHCCLVKSIFAQLIRIMFVKKKIIDSYVFIQDGPYYFS